jgi:hypothetical protein
LRLAVDVDGGEHHAGTALPMSKLGLLKGSPGVPAYFGALGPCREAEPKEQGAAFGADDVAPAGEGR